MTRSAVIIGIGTVAEALARRMAAHSLWSPAMIISSPGPNKRMERAATEAGARYLSTERVRDEAVVREIRALMPDFLFSADNQQKFSQDLLRSARVGSVNFHNGPLPAYRGTNIPSWVIWNGERRHEISWHWMLKKIDAGATVLAHPVDIQHDESAFTLTVKCVRSAVESIPTLLDKLVHTQPSSTDESAGGRYYARAQLPNDGYMEQSWSVEKVLRLARALDYGRIPTHVPAMRIRYDGQDLQVRSIRPVDNRPTGPVSSGRELVVKLADGFVIVSV